MGGATPERVGPPAGRPTVAKVGRSCPGVGEAALGHRAALNTSGRHTSLADGASSGPCLVTLEKLLPSLECSGIRDQGDVWHWSQVLSPTSTCFSFSLSTARRQFPPSPSAPKIPSWQIPVKSSSPSSPAAVNHHSSSDISPVSNESTSSSPGKDSHSPEGSTATYHLLGPQEEGEGVLDVKGQVRMEVQGEEEKREDKEDEDDEDDDVSHVDEEDVLGVQREDRRGGDGQINEQVEKLRRPEGASNETERD